MSRHQPHLNNIGLPPKMTKEEQRYWEARERGNRAFADGVAYDNCPYGDPEDADAWQVGWRESEDESK